MFRPLLIAVALAASVLVGVPLSRGAPNERGKEDKKKAEKKPGNLPKGLRDIRAYLKKNKGQVPKFKDFLGYNEADAISDAFDFLYAQGRTFDRGLRCGLVDLTIADVVNHKHANEMLAKPAKYRDAYENLRKRLPKRIKKVSYFSEYGTSKTSAAVRYRIEFGQYHPNTKRLVRTSYESAEHLVFTKVGDLREHQYYSKRDIDEVYFIRSRKSIVNKPSHDSPNLKLSSRWLAHNAFHYGPESIFSLLSLWPQEIERWFFEIEAPSERIAIGLALIAERLSAHYGPLHDSLYQLWSAEFPYWKFDILFPQEQFVVPEKASQVEKLAHKGNWAFARAMNNRSVRKECAYLLYCYLNKLEIDRDTLTLDGFDMIPTKVLAARNKLKANPKYVGPANPASLARYNIFELRRLFQSEVDKLK